MQQEPRRNAVVTVCSGHAEVETALRNLRAQGFTLSNVSVVGRDLSSGREVLGLYQVAGACKYWGPLGAFWEGLWESLESCGAFWSPGFGSILIAGPFTKTFVAGLENSSVFSGLTAIGSALYSLGIPLGEVLKYEANLRDTQLLLIVHGAATVVETARQLLQATVRQSF
jgi:hypothetical protein